MKKKISLALAGLSILIAAGSLIANKAEPTPAPFPSSEISLRGAFVGPTAANDCLAFGHLCGALASMIEWDGMQEPPRLQTGASFDDLRRLAREFRLEGESIGNRQPKAADEIADYLTNKIGTDGGPVGPAQRAEWVAAFREIERACADAVEN